MSFLHLPVLLVGSLFVSAPIVLHLLMKRKPTHMVFPALQFVQETRVSRTRKLNVRHWLLLLLRCLVVLALAIALARPIVASTAVSSWLIVAGLFVLATSVSLLAVVCWQRSLKPLTTVLALTAAALFLAWGWLGIKAWNNDGNAMPAGAAEAPVAAAVLIDTSPTMGLVQQSRSRLEQAQMMAHWVIRQLPDDSQIIVAGGRRTTAVPVDRHAADREIDSLQIVNSTTPVPQLLDRVWQTLESTNLTQREIYLFTDLTENSWTAAHQEAFTERIRPANPPMIYVVDVGVDNPSNLSLGDLHLSQQHLSESASLELGVNVHSLGIATTRNVELRVEVPDANLPMIVDGHATLPSQQLRNQREVSIAAGDSQHLKFTLNHLPKGVSHGTIRLTGSDGLKIDDIRYFSVETHPPWKILVVNGPGANPDYLVHALSPVEFRETGQALYQCRILNADKIVHQQLSTFAAVALLDPDTISNATWQALGDYIRSGGGLLAAFGRNAVGNRFDTPAALSVLPARLARVWRSGNEGEQFSLGLDDHPILKVLKSQPYIPWSDLPIRKHWQVTETTPHTQTIMRYSDGQPAIMESQLGSGRVIMMTTPLSDPLNVPGRRAWNQGTDSWPFVVLVNEMIKHVSQGNKYPLNCQVGQPAHISLRPGDPAQGQLFHPDGVWQTVSAVDRSLTVPFTDVPGTYRLKSTRDQLPQGFSVNLPAEATQLQRIDTDFLDARLGTDTYLLSSQQDEIRRQMGVARSGHEFYPWVLLLVVVALGLELALSNRFYGSGHSPTTRTAQMEHA